MTVLGRLVAVTVQPLSKINVPSDLREESLFTSGLGKISRCARNDKEPELLLVA